jgi:hypothetical protein
MTNQNSFQRFPLIAQKKVNEVPCTIPFRFDFSGTAPITTQAVDLALIFEAGQISAIRTIFIDNAGFSPVIVTFDLLGISIRCPGASQGYFPVLVPSSAPRMTVQGALGGGAVTVALMNVELPASQWAADRRDNYLVGASVIPANFTGEHYNRNWMADKHLSGNRTATGSATILNPGATNGVFITSIYIAISGNAAQAVAGENQITLNLGAMQICDLRPFIPNASGNNLGVYTLLNQTRLGINSNALGDVLSIFMANTLTTGHLFWSVGCGLSSIANIN